MQLKLFCFGFDAFYVTIFAIETSFSLMMACTEVFKTSPIIHIRNQKVCLYLKLYSPICSKGAALPKFSQYVNGDKHLTLWSPIFPSFVMRSIQERITSVFIWTVLPIYLTNGMTAITVVHGFPLMSSLAILYCQRRNGNIVKNIRIYILRVYWVPLTLTKKIQQCFSQGL